MPLKSVVRKEQQFSAIFRDLLHSQLGLLTTVVFGEAQIFDLYQELCALRGMFVGKVKPLRPLD